MVEFSIVFVLFMFLLWAIVSYGFIFALEQSMTHAAAEGARTAVGSDPGFETFVADSVVDDQLDWLGNKATHVVVSSTTAPCDYDTTEDCLTVSVTYPYQSQPLIPALFSVLTPAELQTQATVQLD